MRKILTISLALMLCVGCFGFVACGENGNEVQLSEPTEAPATAAPTSVPTEEPCAHVWTEANYQTPKICEVCGETEGNPLTPWFEEKGYSVNSMVVGETYPYVTACYDDKSKETIGKVTVTEYKVFESDETHEAKEGYEWRFVSVTLVFDDENTKYYGASYNAWAGCYYIGNKEKAPDPEEIKAKGEGYFAQDYNGKEYECWRRTGWDSSWDKKNVLTAHYEYEALLPIGYDGAIFLFVNSGRIESGAALADVIDENTLFFRLV